MIQQTPDVVEIGRTAAQLSDWQTITYFLMVVVLLQMIERAWYAGSVRKERQDMTGERERMWEVSKEFGAAGRQLGNEISKVTAELQVQQALEARFERVLAAIEVKLGIGK